MSLIKFHFFTLKVYFFVMIVTCAFQASSVDYNESNELLNIISSIQKLENNKDPKCYATASRLEDFMYGTPLDEAARNIKIDIQKKIIYFIKQKASLLAKKAQLSEINLKQARRVINSLATYQFNDNQDIDYSLDNQIITITNKDFQQYSSVSYGYRSMLSVTQDLLFLNQSSTLSFNDNALKKVNEFINILTLVTLKIADSVARLNNKASISKQDYVDTWVNVLQQSKGKIKLAQIAYPNEDDKSKTAKKSNHDLLKKIIKQKISSYEKYNKLTESVFLRNIQVYFAKQKWPKDLKVSNELRSYYLESLILFSQSLLKLANKQAIMQNKSIIRIAHVQKALLAFLPSSTNSFEDVRFFPNLNNDNVVIESYDLDAFRDSGFHWRILAYSLDDLTQQNIMSLDPNAAEQFVEGVAQMGVLVLRLAGEISHQNNNKVLMISDLNQGFERIQNLISQYDYTGKNSQQSNITSSQINTSNNQVFSIANEEVGIDFEHKSSDWLNRLIRGYSTSYKEGKIKLAIPPAFGGSGVACEDINNDGYIDVLLLGGFGNKLFLNKKDGQFQDITKSSGLNSWNKQFNSFAEVRQPIIADFDNDGKQDIFISQVNENHKIYKNIGNHKFVDLSEFSNITGIGLVAGPATALDFDNDGLLDIFIGYFGDYIHGVLPTLSRDNQNGLHNKLYKNLGDFVFQEVQFTDDLQSDTGWTQAVGHADINQDGWQDIIVGNDFGANKYYMNNQKGKFIESSAQLGTNKPSYTMNIGITDLNGDLHPDFYISNIVVMQKDEKYVNPNVNTTMKFDPEKMANIRTIEANDLFLSSINNTDNINYQTSNKVGRGYSATGWSWDADFFDFDNDGDEDLYCLNGMNDFSVYSSENPFYFERSQNSKIITYAKSNREKNVFFVNESGSLVNKAKQLGADLKSNARSACYLDYDEDGDLDIIINNYHEKASFLKNNSKNNNNWIKIKLVGNPKERINKDAIGSNIVLNSQNNKNIWREIHSTTGYLSVHPKIQHFGLGQDTKTSIKINWSNGKKVVIEDLNANNSYIVKYPNIVSKINQINK